MTDSSKRMAALADLAILDTEPEPEFDDIVLLARQICHTPVALISFVATERQWFKAKVGFPRCETPLNQSVCAHALRQDATFVIPDLTLDERTKHNTLVTEPPHIRFYAGALLHSRDGVPIGTLCVIDTAPRPEGLPEEQRLGLEALARQTMAMLDTRRRHGKRVQGLELELDDERQTAALREQFIAVLGHDLRSPLQSITSGMNLLSRTPLNDRATMVVKMVQSSVKRMDGLIEDIMDFARGRLGSGVAVQRTDTDPLEPVLRQVVAEVQASTPERSIKADFELTSSVHCDHRRIGQLVVNLLANAVTHGAADQPILFEAETSGGWLTISVANGGKMISPETLEQLFQPFTRSNLQRREQGLGLGLFIAQQIATAHDGKITVASTPDETRFTFRMPLNFDSGLGAGIVE